jgi:lipopolysaccharide transport system permease protein
VTSGVPGRLFLRNLIGRRNLLFQLVRRDFEQRFIGSAAGWLWGLIHPLVLLLSWTFVFQWCLRVPLPPSEVTQNYTLFLFAGYLPWLLFQDTVVRSSTSIVDHANLITKTVFPAEIVPLSVFFSSLIHHLLALSLTLAGIAVWEHRISPYVAVLPFYMALIGLLGTGLGWIASSLQVYLRDTAQVLTVALTLWFWITPIFINEDQYPAELRFVVAWNPLAYLVRAYRERLLSTRVPSLEEFAVIAAYAVAAFVLGGLFFRHLKRGFADVL